MIKIQPESLLDFWRCPLQTHKNNRFTLTLSKVYLKPAPNDVLQERKKNYNDNNNTFDNVFNPIESILSADL